MTDDTPPHSSLRFRPLTLFSYTAGGHAPLYRSTMRLFLEAKERYRIQLRPDEVAAGIAGALTEEPDRATLERALDQLVDWGNLRRSHDTGRVATLEDFRRRHYVYQMTPAGEAAERAVGRVVEALESSGSLQRVMLGAILRNLEALAAEMARDDPRPEPLYEHLFTAAEQFRALTENASTFLARLHEAIDAGEVDTSSFLLYKQAVLEYLEQFVGELSQLAPRIAGELLRVEAPKGDDGEKRPPLTGRMIRLAAEADTTPTPEGRRDRSAELERQWRGMVSWFVGDGREAATVELLRGAARNAINRILLVLERLHEKRFRRVDRTADLLRLAGWFDHLAGRDRREGGEAEGHRLFATAFGLYGARHLGERHEDPDLAAPPAGSATSWWEAPPVPVAPVLRRTGRTAALGRTPRAVDHAEARRFLAERHRKARAARAAALERFAGRGPLPLPELTRERPLSADEFDLLLSLLDRLLALPPAADGARTAQSRDGLLDLRLEEPGGDARAVVRAPRGRLDLPAYTLTVEDRTAGLRSGAGGGAP